ncbi:AraC family transcriptional regulator [Paenibacillus sp. NRS-1775]|uniref:AraC family transcriptional regulator n=1 Tax=Paenibacillus sp. NRS-1775 TaxID=3233903 RepID=UPI003D329995
MGGENRKNKWEEYEDEYEELLKLYQVDLLSFEQIGERANIDWWNIKLLFRAKGVRLISHKERSKIKRANDYPMLYDLHYNQGLTLNQIYAKYQHSPPYIRQVFRENHSLM